MPKTLHYAVKHSFPIFISFVPVALAYGVLMESAGYNFIWTGACSFFVLAGSLQYLMVSFFAGGVSLATVAVMALMVNSRHIFYGLSFIEKFRSFGLWKYFLIFSLTDENYSLHCSHNFPDDINEKWAYVVTASMAWMYWVVLSIAGALIGTLIPFDTTGIDFALTALFIVILIEQMKGADNRLPALLAFVSSIVCLIFFGPSNFILPSLLITVALLIILRSRIEPVKPEEKEEN
jgi:4-azaleucine resistance transporter AzlC